MLGGALVCIPFRKNKELISATLFHCFNRSTCRKLYEIIRR